MQGDEYKLGIGRMILVGAAAILCGLLVTVWGLSVSRSSGSGDAVESQPVATESISPTTQPLVPITATPTTTQAPAATEEAAAPATAVTTVAPETTEAPTTTELTETTEAPTTTATAFTVDETPSFPTLDDGSPAPIIAIFDGGTIDLSGVVPSEEASDRLQTLAIANSTAVNASIVDTTTINPDVPPDVGVRVAETESVQFAVGSSVVSAANAVELDRRVAIMQALPDITATVIGHADQQGDADVALAAARAQSVVDYLTEQGVDPSRLSARAAGSADLLALNSSVTAAELERRIEIVLFGLLIEP